MNTKKTTNPNPWQEAERVTAILATQDLTAEERKELETRLESLKRIQTSACNQVEKEEPSKRWIFF